jgi:nucleotide-binding universal stress UspA family protein
MYRTILVPIDNSRDSHFAEAAGVRLADACRARLTGLHVNSGMFHRQRFGLLEEFLPDRYQSEEVLQYQRKIHSVLIGRGLEIISLEYMKFLRDHCRRRRIEFSERIIDGKNATGIIDQSRLHEVTILGSAGLGEVEGVSRLGSNARRLIRHGQGDVLIVRKPCLFQSITIGIDGSQYASMVLERVLPLARLFHARLRIVSSFDSVLHQHVFATLATVLSAEAGSVFRFNEQQGLHSEVIDSSLEGLYWDHLRRAQESARLQGVDCSTELLHGKPFQALCQDVAVHDPDLVVVGRFGLHRGVHEEIGSNAEAVAELAGSNVLIVSVDAPFCPSLESRIVEASSGSGEGVEWDGEARQRLERIPSFARPMAMLAIERFAKEQGITVITPEVMMKARERSV